MSLPTPFMTMLQEKASDAGLWRVEPHGRGAELMRQGAPCDQLFLLKNGLVKLTYLTPSGEEWIKSFIMDEGLFGSLDGANSRFGARAVEACAVARLPASWAREAIDADPAFARQAAAFSQWLLARKQQREEALLCDSAETRYRRMLVEEAALLARLPQGDIARFLRVTPIAFSRIKRRIRCDKL
jgi:CRP-like cAMP-binding protein